MSDPLDFDDGGHAFPRPDSVCSESDAVKGTVVVGSAGMSLRDYFAAAAIQGYLAAHADPECRLPKQEELALYAYGVADAMLDVRSKTTPE